MTKNSIKNDQVRKILLTGSPQIEHISLLLNSMGYDVKIFDNKRKWSHICAFLCFLLTCDYLYIVYAWPSNHIILYVANLLRKKIIIHWIGSDVYSAIKHEINYNYSKNTYHIACSENLVNELYSIGIVSHYVPIVPFKMELSICQMPKEHAVLVYCPKNRTKFYKLNIVSKLAELHKNINFYVVANDGESITNKLTNLIFLGNLSKIQMKDLYNKISILFRVIEHDGLSMMLIEALAKGKQVIYQYDFPCVHTPISYDIVDVDKIFSNLINKPVSINYDGHNYICNEFSFDKIIDKYKETKLFD